MPDLTSGLVLVTGASGFLGVHTVRALVDAGYNVRATVRDHTKGAYLLSQVPGVEIALVPDMTVPGAYNTVVIGVDAVVHVASPVDTTNSGPPEAVIGPAVQGVTSLLEAAATEPKIKRVVQISSVAAVGSLLNGALKDFTEEDWNENVIRVCEEQGAAAHGAMKYAASKTMGEKAFWAFFNTPRSFDGVVMNPALLFGPPAGYPPTKVQGSNTLLLPWLTQRMDTELETVYWNHADVRDAATATALALASPAASGERFIVSKGPTHGNDLAIAAESAGIELTKGNRDPAYRASLNKGALQYSNAKIQRVLGLKLRGTDETLSEAAVGIKAILDAKAYPTI